MKKLCCLVGLGIMSLTACTTTSNAESNKPATGESWLDKTGKNAEKGFNKMKEQGTPYYSSCKAEVEKFCKADFKEPTKLFDCLKKNKDQLGPACKTAVEKYAKEHNK